MRLLSVLALAVACLAAADKEAPPAGGPPKAFQLPPTQDFTLPNGMKVTLVPYGEVPRVAVRAYVNAGVAYEASDQTWMSRLTGLLMKEGAGKRSSAEVASEAAEMGGDVQINPGTEYTSVGGIVLSEYGPRFVALIADVLRSPRLPESELARLKNDLVRELAVETARPQSQAREKFLQTLLPDQSYSRIFPKEPALKAYTLAQVQAYYKGNFTAARTHLYVAGKLDSGLRSAIETAFRDWPRGDAPALPTAKAVSVRSLQTIDRPGAAQSTVYLGLSVPDPTHKDYVTLQVMDSILGGAFGSRITANIREDKGYTYSPFSQLLTRHRFAAWIEIADVTTAVTAPSLKEIFYEIERMRKEAPPAAELKAIQSYLSGLFLLRNTISPDAVINQLQFVDSQELPRTYLADYVPKVMAVSAAEIQRVAESYLSPGKMTIVVVGDMSKIGEEIKAYQK